MTSPRNDQIIRDFLHYAYVDTTEIVLRTEERRCKPYVTHLFSLEEIVLRLCQRLNLGEGYVDVPDHPVFNNPQLSSHAVELITRVFPRAHTNLQHCCSKQPGKIGQHLDNFIFQHKLRAFSALLNEPDDEGK